MKKIIIAFAMVLLYHGVNAQNKITGKISDETNQPLPGASVFIPEINKGTVSRSDGSYELLNLPNGRIKVQYSFLGFANHIESISLSGQPVEINIQLSSSPIEAEEIVVSGGYATSQHENAVKIDVLKLKPLEIKSTANLTEVLTRVPGVDMISKGGGVAKPVIRGLSMNDILVLNNGVRFENYQYSSHHPLGIDEFGIDDVEIIKGPASLLYGSDAIGGVINFIKERPAPVGSIMGDYNLQLFSNSLGITNNLGIKGTSKKFFGGIRVGQKTNADFLQGGGDFVPNSRFTEKSMKANVGFTDKIGIFKLYYDYNNQKLGLVEDEAVEEITKRGRDNSIWYQEFNTHLLSSQNKLYLGKLKLEVNSAFQNTELTHLGEVDQVEIQMGLATLTYEAKLHLPSNENSEYIVGFQGFNQKNKNLNNRETLLLPDAVTNNYSGFGLLRYTFFEKLRFQAGLRYDKKWITTDAIGSPLISSSYRAAIDEYFGSFSGSMGLTYNYSEKLLFRANFAAAYRTPNLAELTSNGPHELRYEIGNANLIPENAYESDLSIHYHQENITFDLAGFYNLVDHFIYIAPTGETSATGLAVYRYKQANSSLIGGEAGLHIHPKPIEWLHLETTFSTVTGKQDNGDYLPFIPAHKLHFELRVEKDAFAFIENVFAAINTSTAFAQNNAAPDETKTPGYTLLDLSIGGKIRLSNQLISFSLSANNLLDKKYIDHLSTLKEVSLFNPGRNIALTLKVPFGIK
ncbi:MAG: TonB-dependent receptor [Bacteroidales bacterium]|nr:TonB-dependent receptor [Bacteroidales bacterium]MCF8456286.1 TonB-dependent receptor [Bacteroidales bacterium]